MEQKNTQNNAKTLKNRIHENASPGIMAIACLGIFLMALPMVAAAGEGESTEAGRDSYRPADFPSIFGKPPVEGLASISSLRYFTASPSAEDSKAHLTSRPPFSEGIFPCSNCHAGLETDEKPHKVGPPHDDIILNHGVKEERWCLDCHNTKDRDLLRLINGTTIPFEESPRLCGQCHGTVYRDWKIGVHGKRVGFWNGPKIYLLCVNCHNQHSPRFRQLTPLPPPVKPEYQRPYYFQSSPPIASDSRKYEE